MFASSYKSCFAESQNCLFIFVFCSFVVKEFFSVRPKYLFSEKNAFIIRGLIQCIQTGPSSRLLLLVSAIHSHTTWTGRASEWLVALRFGRRLSWERFNDRLRHSLWSMRAAKIAPHNRVLQVIPLLWFFFSFSLPSSFALRLFYTVVKALTILT